MVVVVVVVVVVKKRVFVSLFFERVASPPVSRLYVKFLSLMPRLDFCKGKEECTTQKCMQLA